MKKKLLITLGCSLTEGVGCYDMDRMPPGKKYSTLDEEEKNYQKNRFHEFGWPNQVGRGLGFDKVINLGLGASSNSFAAKLLVEKVLSRPDWLENDVYVLWLATEPQRFSFFNGNLLVNYQPSAVPQGGLSECYLRNIKESNLGSLNEQVFYTKVVEQVCQNNNFKLAIMYWNSSVENLYRLYKSKYNVFSDGMSLLKRAKLQEEEDLSPICKHPNELGYEKLAIAIIEGLQEFRPEFIVGTEKREIEWEWHGDSLFPEKVFDKILL